MVQNTTIIDTQSYQYNSYMLVIPIESVLHPLHAYKKWSFTIKNITSQLGLAHDTSMCEINYGSITILLALATVSITKRTSSLLRLS